MADLHGSTPVGDAHLLARIARGDGDALGAFYRAHVDAVFRFVYTRVGENREDAQELTEDTFVSALALAGSYDGCCSPLTWLCGIAKLRLTDFHRRRSRLKRIPTWKTVSLDANSVRALCDYHNGQVEPEGVLERLDSERLVDALLERLSPDERDALVLRYADELSVREIAAVLGRTEKAIDSLLTRAKEKAKSAAANCGLTGGVR